MQPRPRRAQQIPVAQHHRRDAPRREGEGDFRCRAVIAPPRAFTAAARDVEENLFQRAPAVARQQPLRRVVVLDAAVLHDDDTFAQPLDLGHVVRGEQHGGIAVATIALEPRPHPVGGVGIERRGRLVEQQQFRRVDQRLRQRHPRLLSGRELPGLAVEQIGEVEGLAEFLDAAGKIGYAIEHAEHGEILPDGEPHRHFDVGTFEIHALQHAVALARHFRPEHPDAAGGRRDEPHDHRDGGGLAGAVAAEKAGDRARREANEMPSTAGTVL